MIDVVVAAVRRLAERGELPRDLVTRAMSWDTTIDELGIDSLGKLNLLSELEEQADVTLSEGMIVGLATLGDLAHVLMSIRKAS